MPPTLQCVMCEGFSEHSDVQSNRACVVMVTAARLRVLTSAHYPQA